MTSLVLPGETVMFSTVVDGDAPPLGWSFKWSGTRYYSSLGVATQEMADQNCATWVMYFCPP